MSNTFYTVSSEYVGTEWMKYKFESNGFIVNSEGDNENRPRYILAEDDNDAPEEDEVGTVMLPLVENAIPEGQIIFYRSGQDRSLISILEQNK